MRAELPGSQEPDFSRVPETRENPLKNLYEIFVQKAYR